MLLAIIKNNYLMGMKTLLRGGFATLLSRKRVFQPHIATIIENIRVLSTGGEKETWRKRRRERLGVQSVAWRLGVT